MNYLDIITLPEAKIYLRIDDTQSITDDEIIQMIEGAISYVEKETNVIAYARDITYDLDEGERLRVYDYPINSVTGATLYQKKNLYSLYDKDGDDPVVLNVGFTDCEDYPKELKQAALQILKVWYYESETDQNSSLLPMSVKMAVDKNRRFIL